MSFNVFEQIMKGDQILSECVVYSNDNLDDAVSYMKSKGKYKEENHYSYKRSNEELYRYLIK